MLRNRVYSRITRAAKLSQGQYVRSTAIAAERRPIFDEEALSKAKPFEEIPSMLMLPLLGTSWMYMPIVGLYDPQKHHLSAIDKRRRLGDIYREKVGSINLVLSFNADDMQVIFQNEGPYPYRAIFDVLKTYRESRKQWYKSTGVLLLQGKEWHDLRSKCQKHLLKPKAIQAYLSPMQDVARDLVNKMHLIRDANKEIPDFLGELYKWALESVALVGLDTRLGCLELNVPADSDGMKMIDSVQTQFECMNKLEAIAGNIPFWKYFPTPTWRKFEKAADTFTEIAFRYINRSLDELKKTAGDEDKDLTLLQSMLMTEGLDVGGTVVMVADMLAAGIDTTSHSVGFFFYHLARNPDKQELLYEEIKKLLPRKEDKITTEVYNEMKYLKACIKESQRLDPIIGGVIRILPHDVIFSGYRVPAKTVVAVGIQAIQREEKYFSNPNQYLPERWLKKDEKFHPFSFLPFGVGTRSCIGRRLAELEVACLITEIMRNFRVEYHYEDIGMFTRMISTPDKPLRYKFIER